ncbi:MAG: TIGR00159 family protein [Lachnospiraceae bacterium]|nr:TIGR00159 family protein [Lachnospiraceae bacterium]
MFADIFGGEGLGQFLFTTFQFSDFLDILVVAFIIYEILIWIRRTRGWILFKGIIIVVVIWLIAQVMNLNMVSWVFEKAFSVGILAVIIIFQPELRRALERLGTGSILQNMVGYSSNKVTQKTAVAIIDSTKAMSKAKTGALIAVEQKVGLGEYEQTGIAVDAEISSELLINIFEKNTPLHDGAVIIRGNRVLAATCYLPLTDNSEISKELGTRHRAALGLSEVSDAKVFIVSEETGAISMAQAGKIYHGVDAAFLRKELTVRDEEEEEEAEKPLFQRLLRSRAKKVR